MNGILTLQSGSPFTFFAGVDRSLVGVGLDHADLLGPVDTYNDRSRASKVARYFDTTPFALPALGTFGIAGRNTMYGPGIGNFDAGLFKQIPVTEQRRFELRWEVFNALNRPNFLNSDSSLQSTAFGRVTAVRDPRIMQIAEKLYF